VPLEVQSSGGNKPTCRCEQARATVVSGIPDQAPLERQGTSSHTGREVGPLERGFTSATNPEDFKGWVVEFHNEWSDELAKLPETLADAQKKSR
jgi:hypothetical protein